MMTNLMYFQDSYNVQLTKEQEDLRQINFDIHDFTYNTCLDLTLSKTFIPNNSPIYFSIDEWMKYMQQEFLNKPRPIFGLEYMHRADPIIVYGALTNLYNDLSNYLNMNQHPYFLPTRKVFGNNQYRIYSISFDPRINKYIQISELSNLAISIPTLGNIKLVNSLANYDLINLQNSSNSRIVKIDIIADKNNLQDLVVIHKEEIMQHVEPINQPGTVALYVGEDITTITLSDGNRKVMPSSLLDLIAKIQHLEIAYKEDLAVGGLTKLGQNLGRLQLSTTEWYKTVASQLVEEYNTIYVENQPRITIHTFNKSLESYLPSWLRFMTILNQKCKEEKIMIKNITKNSEIINTCHICGMHYKQLPMIDDTSWGCRICHTIHDTDINAATNILKTGIWLDKQNETRLKRIPHNKNFNSILYDYD